MQTFRMSCKGDISKDCQREIELEKEFRENRESDRNKLKELIDKEFNKPKNL